MSKLIDADKLIAKIERRKADAKLYDMSGGYAPIYDELLSIIASLQREQPSLPSNLDEAAWEYFVKTYGIDNIAISEDIKRAVKFGAEWMAGQGEAFEGEIVCAVAHPHENKVIARVYGDYKFGDKVVVQIRKK